MSGVGYDEETERALKIMRTLIIAGCDAVNQISKDLLSTSFFKVYSDYVETGAGSIHFDLSSSSSENPDISPSKFYPLPFRRRKSFLITFVRPYFFINKKDCKIDIIQVPNPPFDALGYRVERGRHGICDMHGYLHVQAAGSFKVSGRNRVPSPPAMITAFISLPPRLL